MLKYLKVVFTSILLVTSMLSLAPINARAEYGTDNPPVIGGEPETFGVNTEKGESATFFPDNCPTIESVNLKAKNDLNGSIEVISYGKQNPVGNSGLGKKIVEICEMKFTGFTADDIESSVFTLKVTKEELENLKLDKDKVRLFQFDTDKDKWGMLDTSRKSETGDAFMYESDDVSKYAYFAVAEKTGFDIGTLPFIICGFLLLLAIIILMIFATLSRKSEEEDKNKTY